VKSLGLHNEPCTHYECAFVDGRVAREEAKQLLKKLTNTKPPQHTLSAPAYWTQRKSTGLMSPLSLPALISWNATKENSNAIVTVFRTAYECTMSHLPCTEHSRLITLQALNGVCCGNILYSNHVCSSIVNHISEEMHSEIVSHIINISADFSIMIVTKAPLCQMYSLSLCRCTLPLMLKFPLISLV